MKRAFSLAPVLLVALCLAALAFAGTRGTMALKLGEEVRACDCGESCPCNTMSRNPGECTCGKKMVEAKAVRVEEGNVLLKGDAWDKERPFKMAGKYTCDCPPSCPCDTQSQNPGKCTCGKKMREVEM